MLKRDLDFLRHSTELIGRCSLLKEEVEKLLVEYALRYPEITISAKKINTNVYKNDNLLMRIFYRTGEIRITIKSGTPQHGEYFALFEEQLVYQKNSANPYETGEMFSFFVAKNNIPVVIDRLLMSEKLPTDAQMTDFLVQSKQSQLSKKTAIPLNEQASSDMSKNAAIAVASNQKIEKKLDYLINAFSNTKLEKKPKEKPAIVSEEIPDKRFRIEPTKPGAPYIISTNISIITGLIFTLKIHIHGNDSVSEQYKLFFANKNGEIMSQVKELSVCADSDLECTFELKSASSEETNLYLVVQGKNAKEDEVRQLIEFPVKIAFTADFGL